ncbi:MAG TPA: tetratricopeptide repeat protein [Anaerolineae bacterium]|nr:tetratricopeptide repeat protein [Anaerolineae bacterium]
MLHDPAMSGRAAIDLLSQLVDRSLVIVDHQNQAARNHLLETIREYGLGKTMEAGELNLARRRHLDFFVRLAAEHEAYYHAGGEAESLEMEHDNLRAAIEWSLESEDASTALQLASTMSWLWWMRGYLGERKERLREIVAHVEATAPSGTLERMKLLNAAGALLSTWGDHTEARRLLEEALAIGMELGDKPSSGLALRLLGTAALNQGDYPAARSFLERGVAVWRELESQWHVGWLLTFLGDTAVHMEDFERAQALYEEAVTWSREFMAKSALAYPVRRLGYLALYRGDTKEATALCRESLGLNMEVGDKQGMAACLAALAGVAVARGQAVSLRVEDGPPRHAYFRRAAKLFGIIEALLNDVGTRLLQADNIEYERVVAAVRSQLDETAFAAAWAASRSMTLVPAMAYALADDTASWA